MPDKLRRKAPTGIDVAEKAGVSQSTVSLVVSGKANGRVSPALQERVRRAAQDLGYQPNAAARSLRLGRAFSIALVVPSVQNPYFSSVLRGAEYAARKQRYAVMLLDTRNDRDWLQWVPDVLAGQTLDGCIVYAGDPVSDDDIIRLGMHVVVIEATSSIASSVLLDVRSGTAQAIQHFVDLGHTRIGHLAAVYERETFRIRSTTYREILEKNAQPVVDDFVVKAPFDIASAVMAARQLLNRRDRPTAIFCDDDLLAAGVYKAAHGCGLEIPRDLSVVGFNNSELARILEPELTTVSIPTERVGKVAMQLMQRLLKGRPPTSQQIPLSFVVRASTAPPT